MSDISKKIFSIDPDPHEDPIAHVPPLPVDSEIADEAVEESAPSRAPLQLRPLDELTDSDIVSAIRTSGPIPEDQADKADAPIDDQPITDEPLAIVRRPTMPVEPGPPPSLVAAVAPRQRPDPIAGLEPSTSPYGWIGFLLTILTAATIAAILYVIVGTDPALSPVDMAAIALAIIVPAATVGTLWSALRALSRLKNHAAFLATTANRLTHVDDTVTGDVAHMASAIRSELAGVDQHLSETRQQLLTVTEQAAVQGTELSQMTRTAADNADMIDQAITNHREQFRGLMSDFEIRLQSLAQSVERHTNLLETTSTNSASKIETVTQTMGSTLNSVSERGKELSDYVESADASLNAAEERLTALSERIAERTSHLDSVYERRSEHLAGLSERMDDDASKTETALTHQAEQLSAIDSQINATEQRLTALLDHARGIQSQLSSRLSDIDSTLSEADRRSRAFTADMSDRVNDSVAQTRRELSIMEGELRVLQARMKAQPDPELGFGDAAPDNPQQPSGRLHLQPLETDFPPVEPQALDIPDEPDEALLDLVEVVEIPSADSQSGHLDVNEDVVRRPGTDPSSRKPFGRPKREDRTDTSKSGGWRWRDMLGAIDPLDEASTNEANLTPQAAQPGVDRPPPGVPLAPPSTAPLAPSDGSDVVARLCEVQLAPSAVVDEGTIYEAAAVRQTGGEEAQNACVQARLEGPVLHLRRVVADDLEFKLRAESFRRSYADSLIAIHNNDALQAKLGSATGRAYLLCAAALSAE